MVDSVGNNVPADIKAILASLKKQSKNLQTKLCTEERQKQISNFPTNNTGSSIDNEWNIEDKYQSNNRKQTILKPKASIITKEQPSVKSYFNVVKQSTNHVGTSEIHDILRSIKSKKDQSHTEAAEGNNVIHRITTKCLMKDNVSRNTLGRTSDNLDVNGVRNIKLSSNSNKLSSESHILNTTNKIECNDTKNGYLGPNKFKSGNISLARRTEDSISNLICSQNKSTHRNSSDGKDYDELCITDTIKNKKVGKHVESQILTKRENISFDDFCNNILKSIDNRGVQTIKNIDTPNEVGNRENRGENFLPKSCSTGVMELKPKKYSTELNSLPITNCEIKGRKQRMEKSKLKFDDFVQNLSKELKCNSQLIEAKNNDILQNKKEISVELSSYNLKRKGNSNDLSSGSKKVNINNKTLLDFFQVEEDEDKKVKQSSQNNIFHMKNKRRKIEELSTSEEKITSNENIGTMEETNKLENLVVNQTAQNNTYDKTKSKDTHSYNFDTLNTITENIKLTNEGKAINMGEKFVRHTDIKSAVNEPYNSQILEHESEDFLPYFSQFVSKDFITPIDSEYSKPITQPELSKLDISTETTFLNYLHCSCALDQNKSGIAKVDSTEISAGDKSFQFETPMDTQQFFENSLNFVDYVAPIKDDVYKADEIKHGQIENIFENLIKEQQQKVSSVNRYTKNRVAKKKCHVKRYKKGEMKIYRIKRLKKPKLKNKVQSQIDEPLHFNDVFKKLTQNVIEVENNLSRSKSMSSISTSSSYITDITNSDVLSTGSHELTSPQKRLRKGINELLNDKSLLCPQRDWETPTNDDKDELKMKIQEVFLKVGEDFMEKRPSSLKHRRHSFDNCIFKDGRLQLRPIEESSMTVIKSSHARSKTRFKLLLYIMKKIQTLLETNTKLTKRELYYQLKTLVGDQRVIDRIISSISSLLDVGAWALNIIAQKGLVFGNLKILLSSGEFLNCNIRGTLIPQDVSEIVEIHSRAYFILVVEKESIFYKLIDEGLPERLTRPFIMITGKGFPDLNTQLFLNKLWMVMSIPVFILVDGDPHGINIMLNYRFGSVNNAHVSHHLAVPNAKWLGIYPSEIVNLNLTREPLSVRELKLVEYLMKTPYVEGNSRIVSELKVLQEKKYKAEIEGLIKTDTFLTDVYLSNKFFTHNFI